MIRGGVGKVRIEKAGLEQSSFHFCVAEFLEDLFNALSDVIPGFVAIRPASDGLAILGKGLELRERRI